MVALFAMDMAWSQSADRENEAALKAVYLVNVAKFVSWPEDSRQEVRLCIGSQSPVYDYLQGIKNVLVGDNLPLVIEADPQQLSYCNLLYVDGPSESSIPMVDAQKSLTGLLTITDISRSIGRGYAIQFFVRDLKLRFTIDEQLVNSASYRVSSKLMRMARRLD